MKYHIELFTRRGWVRVVSDLTKHHVANNMKQELAKQTGLDVDNYSILVEVQD